MDEIPLSSPANPVEKSTTYEKQAEFNKIN